MAPRRYDASSHPWRMRYWHQNMFAFIAFAANVVAVVTPKARCLPGAQSLTQGKLVGAKGQDPCVLAASVIETCDKGPWTLLPLEEVGQSYPAPGFPGSVRPTECSCSRMAYNLFSACAACQRISGIHWLGYSDWDQICEIEQINNSAFDSYYSGDPTFLSWMFISDQDVFSVNEAVNEAIAAAGPTPPPEPSRPIEPPPTRNDNIAGASVADNNNEGNAEDDGVSTGVSTSEDSAATSQSNAATNGPNLLPLILAPTLSVLALAALFGIWCFFYKRKRAKRVAPSAEFTKYQRAPIQLADAEGGGTIGVRGMRSIDDRPASRALQNHGEEPDEDAPPAFTPGLFKDPIFEKGVAMSLANQNQGGSWAARHGHTPGAAGTTMTGGVGGVGGVGDVRTERQDSLTLADGDSPVSLSLLEHGQSQLERQRLIPPEE